MVVGLGVITLRMEACHSLKEKRRIVKAFIQKLTHAFNISAAEVGLNEVHQEAEIGFAVVGNNRVVVNSKIDKVFNLADSLGLAEIIDTQMEIINL